MGMPKAKINTLINQQQEDSQNPDALRIQQHIVRARQSTIDRICGQGMRESLLSCSVDELAMLLDYFKFSTRPTSITRNVATIIRHYETISSDALRLEIRSTIEKWFQKDIKVEKMAAQQSNRNLPGFRMHQTASILKQGPGMASMADRVDVEASLRPRSTQ